MNMQDVINLVNTNRGNGKKENLNRMQALMNKLGNPQDQLKFIHIAGTNGKGTTAAFIAAVLHQSEVKTGLFTSPHLEVINERIQVDQQLISDESFIRCTEIVAPFVAEVEAELSESLYSFEILTAVAFVYFASQNCELIILETGIGGRLDSTNVIQTPEVAVITSIGLDHMGMLGNTVEEIAKEKAGIIKQNGTVVVYDCPPSIRTVIEQTAAQKQAALTVTDLKEISVSAASIQGQKFDYKTYKNLSIRMIGEHQLSNAAIAIETVLKLREKGYQISDQSIVKGLKQAFWAGRMETMLDKPLVLIDGAHNQQGVERLSQNIRSLFPRQKVTYVIGMMKDKDYLEMIHLVEDTAKQFLTVSPDPWRGFDAEEVAEMLGQDGKQAKAVKDAAEVVQYIKKADQEEIIVVFGSLYLVGDLRKALKQSDV